MHRLCISANPNTTYVLDESLFINIFHETSSGQAIVVCLKGASKVPQRYRVFSRICRFFESS